MLKNVENRLEKYCLWNPTNPAWVETRGLHESPSFFKTPASPKAKCWGTGNEIKSLDKLIKEQECTLNFFLESCEIYMNHRRNKLTL